MAAHHTVTQRGCEGLSGIFFILFEAMLDHRREVCLPEMGHLVNRVLVKPVAGIALVFKVS